MSNTNAQIIDLKELLNANTDDVTEDRVKSDNELEDALIGKDPNVDLLELDVLEKLSNSNSDDTSDDNATKEFESTEPAKDKLEDFLTETTATIDEVTKSNFYKNTLKTMYGEFDAVIEEDEEGNQIEVSLDDKIITEEYFNQLVEAKQQEIKASAAEGKISAKGLSKFALDLVEIDRNGGDISKLIQTKEAYTDPLDQLDLDNEKDQETAVYLRNIAAGQDEDTIRRLIASYKQEGILEDMARKADNELRTVINAQVEQAKELAKQEAEQRKKLFKDYKKEIRDNLDSYQLNDNIKNKIVKLATEQDESGRFEMDLVYRRHRENPKDAADLALFLLDKDEFIKQVTSKAVEDTKLTTAKKLVTVKTTTNKGTTIADQAGRSAPGDINLSELQI